MFYRETQRTTHFYDAQRRLIRTTYRIDTLPSQVFFPPDPIAKQTVPYTRTERMRYDPLGRRVWREMIRDTANGLCTSHDKSSGCRNEVTRTVYDGDQVLYDIRTQADTVGEGSESEGSGTAFTGVVGYTHAGGIDAPLGLFKATDRVWTLTDWRGQYDLGVCGSALCNSSYFFPGAPRPRTARSPRSRTVRRAGMGS